MATKPQKDMLGLLAQGDGWWTAEDLLRHLYEHHQTVQGVTQTAASLVRKGLIQKAKIKGIVHYSRN